MTFPIIIPSKIHNFFLYILSENSDQNTTRMTTLNEDLCFSMLQYTFNNSGIYCINVTAMNLGGGYLMKSLLHINGKQSNAFNCSILVIIVVKDGILFCSIFNSFNFCFQ